MACTPVAAMVSLVVAGALFSGATTAPDSTVNVVGGTSEQRAMAEWAVGRFAEAGLHLPPVEISFPGRDQSECGGAPARAYLDRDPVEVRVCWNSEMMLLHELAHVWEAHAVPQSCHEPFMAMRDGVKSWADLDDAWEERGREHVANVIAWGMLENPYPVSRTYPNDPDSLMTAFRLLTGTDPLHDGGPGIPVLDRSFFEGRSNAPLETGR